MGFTNSELEDVMPDLKRFCNFTAHKVRQARTTGDDLFQDTVEKALKARASFEQGSNLRAWLFTIARNHALTQARRGWRQVDVGGDDWATMEHFMDVAGGNRPSPDTILQLKEAFAVMATLPADQREALELVAVQGASYAEAAATQGVAEGTIKSRVSRARAGLAEEMVLAGEGRRRPQAPPHRHTPRRGGPVGGTEA